MTDPDDVAELVAHDAAVGLPGFQRVPPPPEHSMAELSEVLYRARDGMYGTATADALRAASEVALASFAYTIANHPGTTFPLLMQRLVNDLQASGIAD